jgi:hypothetical protein
MRRTALVIVVIAVGTAGGAYWYLWAAQKCLNLNGPLHRQFRSRQR